MSPEVSTGTTARFFTTPADFRAWLTNHHSSERELLVGFHKVGSGAPSISWPESVDEALCFGWIDGVRKRVDEARYTIRFTPRKPGSNWSAINIARVAVLSAEQRMQPAGLAAFVLRSEARSGIYAYEQRESAVLPKADEKLFRANAAAWRWFEAQPAWYRQQAVWRVISAKREETRQKRLVALIAAASEAKRW